MLDTRNVFLLTKNMTERHDLSVYQMSMHYPDGNQDFYTVDKSDTAIFQKCAMNNNLV